MQHIKSNKYATYTLNKYAYVALIYTHQTCITRLAIDGQIHTTQPQFISNQQARKKLGDAVPFSKSETD